MIDGQFESIKKSGGTKNDQEKIKLNLLSTIWINGVGSVLNFGMHKYAAHNWRKGIEVSRLMDAALRHLLAFNEGEDNDPESGLNHLYHASCCLMFMSELMVTRPDLDDRYKISLTNIDLKNDSKNPYDIRCMHCAQVMNTWYNKPNGQTCFECAAKISGDRE